VPNDIYFNYNAPAELFLAKRTKQGRGNYWRFTTAAGAWLQVGDERFNSTEIERLYEAAAYPLRKPE
jgi:hypothetical protein